MSNIPFRKRHQTREQARELMWEAQQLYYTVYRRWSQGDPRVSETLVIRLEDRYYRRMAIPRR